MKKRIFAFLFIFSLVPLFCFSQIEKRIDSLQNLLKGEMADTQRVKIYNQLANKYRYTDPGKDEEYANKALDLARKLNFQSGLAESYTQLGISRENGGHFQEAISLYDSSATIWQQLNDDEALSNMYLNAANVYQEISDYPSATDYCIRSLKLHEKTNNIFGEAVCKLTLGNILFGQGSPKDALKMYKEVLVLNSKSEKSIGLEGTAITNIAAMFEQLDQSDSALFYERLAIDIFTKNGMENQLGATYGNMGSAFRELGMMDSALIYFRKALSMNFRMKRTEAFNSTQLSMGNFYFENENLDSALFYYEKALLLSQEIGTRDIEVQVDLGLSKVYEKKKEFEKALHYLNQFTDLYDSIHGAQQNSQVEEMQKSYEIDKKNKAMLMIATEKQLAEEANKRNKILYITGSVLMLIVIVIGFIMYRNKQKHNNELELKNEQISQQKEEITASITYARRIQQSVMPDERILKKTGFDYFIFNKPRDIVSGDFYWLAQKEERTYIALADCTGHGVPGALVSVIGINMLNKIIEQPGTPTPSEILELLHVLIIHALNKDADARDTNDGMDIAILCIDKKNNKAFFSGAGRPIYYSDATGLHFLKGDRYSIAGEKKDSDPPFTEHEITLTGTTSFYLSSDGYVDQFGEGTGKKYLSKKFQDLLANISSLPMEEQNARIENDFTKWKGNLEQVDDVMVIGVRV